MLDVNPTASLAEITKQYRKKSLINHPDKNQNIDSTCKMQELNEAKRVLTNEEERKKHDWEIFIYSLKNGDRKKVNFFLKNKCVNFDVNRFDINEKDNVGNTPLHCACFFIFFHSAELLLVNGARVNEKGKDDNTPLHYAIMGNSDGKLIELLISKGCTIKQKNKNGFNSLQLAKDVFANKEIYNLLLKISHEQKRKKMNKFY